MLKNSTVTEEVKSDSKTERNRKGCNLTIEGFTQSKIPLDNLLVEKNIFEK
jgi:hypothetical protein